MLAAGRQNMPIQLRPRPTRRRPFRRVRVPAEALDAAAANIPDHLAGEVLSFATRIPDMRRYLAERSA